MFSSEISAYSMFSMSSLVTSSTFDFCVSNSILLILPPVTDLVSNWIVLRSCAGRILVDFLICFRKERNLLINNFFRWSCPDTGLTKYLCVWCGRSYILLNEVFQVFSTILASAENKSQMGEPVKWELKIWLAWSLEDGCANMNSCNSSQFSQYSRFF